MFVVVRIEKKAGTHELQPNRLLGNSVLLGVDGDIPSLDSLQNERTAGDDLDVSVVPLTTTSDLDDLGSSFGFSDLGL